MSLFQRIKTPFADLAEDGSAVPERPAYAVGELLRERRRELRLDLESIGEALRIKPIYLMAIEQGRTDDLPGPTYALGFVRAYAHHLGLDAERVLASYKAGSAEVHARPDLSLPVPLGARSLPGGPILLVGLILALCGYGTWYYLSTGERSRPERVAPVPAELLPILPQGAQSPTAPDGTAARTRAASTAVAPGGAAAVPQFGSGLIAAQRASSPEATDPGAEPAASAAAASPASAASPVPAAAGPAASGAPSAVTPVAAAGSGDAGASGGIEIRAVADCWIQIRAADHSIVFSRVLKAGETYRVPRPGLILRTGNAGALAIMVDGKPAPTLGGVGTLRRNVTLDPQALLAGTAIRG